jgi:glycosyltransferase involved in cell wall biosynthesis
VIYRGVDVNESVDNLEIKEKYGNKSKILFAGRLIDGKGVVDLLKAVKKIKQLNWVLFIVGDGPQKENLMEQTKKMGIDDKVIFFGQLERSVLLGILKVADIVVNPSYTEGLPTVIVEAAKCGKAIVATDVGGTKEIIEDGKSGVLINPKDSLMLSEKLEMLINDSSLRKKLGETAKKNTKNKFDWETSIRDYINILR